MRRLDYHSPGADDLRLRLRRWENWILLISLFLLASFIILLASMSLA